jgi:hypothetical protein
MRVPGRGHEPFLKFVERSNSGLRKSTVRTFVRATVLPLTNRLSLNTAVLSLTEMVPITLAVGVRTFAYN